MIEKVLLKFVVILFLSVSLNLSSQSQNRNYFVVNGNVIAELNSANYSSVLIIKNNQKSVSSQIPGNGRFRLELEYNAEYRLIFSKKGNQSKAIVVNTEIPEKAINNASNFSHFLMTVKLLAGSRDSENNYSENQIQQICYSSQKNCFTALPSILNAEYVEKGNSNQDQIIRSQVYKAKL
ncbi:hypothetical protein AQPE_0848 [Aquipluma nitroreducens]|uniref:DUF4369 domain-containing protein n=1 Tax=Aquipluma nitroreducens TaxID=2010828 RepID=A0A5K7S5E9_9BACT|nr:hypothetical protein [Aquipluma nitroreducens]BBE16705.1 hypothetical protein AQPE_0848 [Aquipluma nitroreducens]